MNTERNFGPLWILVAALFFSTAGTTQVLAPVGATPYVIGTIRMFCGGLILLAWCTYRNLLPTRHGWWRIETPICIIGLLGLQICFYEGVLRVGVAIGTMTSTGVTPIAAGFFCTLFFGERLSIRWFLSTFIAILGLALITLTENTAITSMQGLMLTTLSGVFYAVYLVASRRLLETHHPETLSMVLILGTGICMLPLVFTYPLAWIATAHGLALTSFIAVFGVAFAFVTLAKGLQTTPAPIASTLSLAEPLCAAMLGIFFLGEPLKLLSGLGMACMFFAVAGLALPTSHRYDGHKKIRVQ